MFGTIIKKKVSDDKLANVFINGLFTTIDNGFPVIAEIINDDPAFVKSPNLRPNDNYEFSLIVLFGNLSFLESAFDPHQADRIETLVYEKLAKAYDMPVYDFKKMMMKQR